MNAETKTTLTDPDVIAVNKDWGGIQGHRIRDDGEQEVWYKPMSDGSAAVVLFNRSSSVAPIAITPSEVYLAPSPEYAVKDLWTNEIVQVRERFETTVPAHGAVMIRISPQNNNGATSLSDLAATPVTNGFGPVERDRSNGEDAAGDGVPLSINGTKYAKGLGVHAYSEIRWALNGRCSAFKANVGIDDEVGSRGSVVFHVMVDGVERYTSPVVTGADGPLSVSVSLTGAAELALVVTDAGDGPYFDHADWAAAQIECNSSNTTSTQYVSDRSWISVNNGWGPVERDRSNGENSAEDGRTLTLNGTRYTKGLGVHAYSEVRYVIGGQCSTFEAKVGVDDEVGSLGRVVFRVFVDGAERYTSRVMTGAAASEPVLVSVAGANVLALVVTDAGDGPAFDHADWADAQLHCGTTSVPLGTSAP
jgi:alpha-galactosidase